MRIWKTSLREWFVNSARDFADWLRLGAGALAHAFSGRTPPYAYQALIRLFCSSGGRSSDAISRWISRIGPAYALPRPSGVLGTLSAFDLAAVGASLRNRGYHVFPQIIPAEMCDQLLEFGLRQPSLLRAEESGGEELLGPYSADRLAPRAVRYDLRVGDVLANADVQALLCDPTILAVAHAYLGSNPIADVLSMWWHTAYSDQPSKAAAQFFHFDMDRVKWLKFFIYLTDVGIENGPHSFVAGSHRTGGIPAALLRKGYARLTDEEVRQHYTAEDLIEFTGAKGTVIVEDTRGLHKGKHVASGDRLVLQLQYSNSLFGGDYPKVFFPTDLIPELRNSVQKYPEIYRNFT